MNMDTYLNVWSEKDDTLEYKMACLYMGKTELYDRTLTELRSPFDPTSAFLKNTYERNMSNAYAKKIRMEISKNNCYPLCCIKQEINKHSYYSAQKWVDEYLRLCGNVSGYDPDSARC